MNSPHILDMCSLSITFPTLPKNLIQRDLYLDNFEMQLENCDILFVRGQREGCGVTIALALFAIRHHLNCVTFFNNGLNLYLTEVDEISNSIAHQLYFYNIGEKYEEEILEIESQLLPLAKTIRKRNQSLYFVFDGFNKLPQEKSESIQHLIRKLMTSGSVKFIFSGKQEEFDYLLDCTNFRTSELGLILPFTKHETDEYFRRQNPNLSSEEAMSLFKFTEGLPIKINYVSAYFEENKTYNPFLTSESKSIEELYQEDFNEIPRNEDNYKLLSLLAYAGIPMSIDAVCNLLQFTDERLNTSLTELHSFVNVGDDNVIEFKADSIHRFIRKRLNTYESHIGSLMIGFFERDQSRYLPFIPALYRKFKKGQLLHFLQSPNVQQILIEQKSQGALNVQCNMGYKESARRHNLPDLFTFSLYKSMSNEMERNELWDNEIEALTAVGDFQTALTLAETVYLSEEKLKSYAIIARRQKEQKGSVEPIILQKITDMHKTVKYEDIPDKSLELAKLLLHVDYKISLEITERVVKSDEGKDMNKIMSMMSLSAIAGYSKPGENAASYDLFASKINDEEVKNQTEGMKSLFTDLSVDEFLSVVKKLPNDFQRLYLLQHWVSSNKKKDEIFKAVKLGFELIIRESSEIIPRASIVSRLCDALPYLNDEELHCIVEMVGNIRIDIRYPSESYTMVQMKVIRAIAPKSIENAVDRLKALVYDLNEHSNRQIAVKCMSLILRDYKKLGNMDYLSSYYMSEGKMLEELTTNIINLFNESAYQGYIIETPVKALVCSYPAFMENIAPKLNTEWQRSMAYSMASIEYVRQMKLKDIDWKYLKDLVSNIKYPVSRAEETWQALVRKCYRRKSEVKEVLAELKKLDGVFNAIEDYDVKCEIFARLYTLFKNEEGYSPYAESLLKRARQSCEEIQIERVKIERGFMMAMIVASVNQDAAKEIISQMQEVKSRHILSSLSCVNTYQKSLHLYLNAFGVLIRSGYTTEDNIQQFESIINEIGVPSETIRYWSDVALNYHLGDNDTRFRECVSEKVLKPYYELKGSERNRKMLLYYIAPSLFYYDSNLFFDLIKPEDDQYLKSACIDHVIKFILLKNVDADEVEDTMIIVELNYDDCLKLINLLSNTVDDEIIFTTVDTICRSILKGKRGMLSNVQRNNVRDLLINIISTKLPAPLGITHKGYSLACKAAVMSLNRPKKEYYIGLKSEIDAIPNTADQAFIYIYLSRFIEDSPTIRNEYIRRGLDIAKTLPVYDKGQRMEMCLKEVKSEHDKLRNFAIEAFRNIVTDGDHNFESCKKIIDVAQMHDTAITQSITNIIDEDPARQKYRVEMKQRVEHNKKIYDARRTPSEIINLDEEELLDFYHFEYNNQLLGKSAVWDENRIFEYVRPAFKYPLFITFEAFRTITENVCKMSDSKRKKELLLKIYNSLFWNLKIVIALASGTKEKLDRLNYAIRETFAKSDSVIRIGERTKAVEKILNWYSRNKSKELRIIDAYFSPTDLYVIKELFDINNTLKVSILTLRRNAPDINKYQEEWDLISSELTGSLTIHTLYYKDAANDGPLHDRWWITGEDESFTGLSSSSLSTLGAKETAFTEMSEDQIPTVLETWNDYVMSKIRSVKGVAIRYNDLEIM